MSDFRLKSRDHASRNSHFGDWNHGGWILGICGLGAQAVRGLKQGGFDTLQKKSVSGCGGLSISSIAAF